MIRVLVVDDHPFVREGLKWILEGAAGIAFGGDAANGAEALKKLREEKYDVALLDISMPDVDGIDTLTQIMNGNSGVKVLILSAHPENKYAVRLMKSGASGYMLKDSPPQQLLDAIRNIFSGKKHISPHLAELLLRECGTDSGKPLHERLSENESQALQMQGSGTQVSKIGKALSLSDQTSAEN